MARGHGRGQGNRGRKGGRATGTVGGGGKGTGTGTGSPGSGSPGSGSPTSSPGTRSGGWRTSGDSLFGGSYTPGPSVSYSPGRGGSGGYKHTFANVTDAKKWAAIGSYDAKKAANLNWNFESYQRQQAQEAAQRVAAAAKIQGQKDEAQKKVKQTLQV